MPELIKMVRFHVDKLPALPRQPLLLLLAQMLATPIGLHGASLAEWWTAVGTPGNFSQSMDQLQADGWIFQAPDGKWLATAKAQSTCVVVVDEVPTRQPGEDGKAWIDRYNDWLEAPSHVLQ